ncbi:MAG: hypothetical protein HQK89_01615 [Nitrospirae bacterium]|nr:hypothetical protein [Nitrospirota bacterium]
MEWKFTPIQVLAKEVEYDIEEYKGDLRKEVSATLSTFNMDEATVNFYCDFVFILFYWIATNQSILTYKTLLEERIPDTSPIKSTMTDIEFLVSLQKDNEELIDMLRTILANLSMDYLARGLDIDEAKKALYECVGFARK